ncbi:hypothetical protein GGI35DRAFT_489889 [Trichoderma velutinum]
MHLHVSRNLQSLKKWHLPTYCWYLRKKHGILEDPITYLGHTFKEPAALLSVMFDTGSIISGSRALEFFVPGSTDKTSDWDFYIPAFTDAIVDMISILNICCNVEWKSLADTIGKDGKPISSKLIENLQTWPNKTDRPGILNAHNDFLGEHANNIIRAYKDKNLAANYRIDYSKTDIKSYNFVGLTFPVMEGTIKSASGNVKVQLIIAAWDEWDTSLLRFIGKFYASHVQCFIGGWYACHMYHKVAKKKKSYKWLPNNQQADKKTREAIKKYEARGYEFIEPQGRIENKFLIDNSKKRESKFIDFWGMYDYIVPDATKKYEWHYSERQKQLRSVTWREVAGELRLHPSDRQDLIRLYSCEVADNRYGDALKDAEEARRAAEEVKCASEKVIKAAEKAKEAVEGGDGDAKRAVKVAKKAAEKAEKAVKIAEEAEKIAEEAEKVAEEAEKAASRLKDTMDAFDEIMCQRLADDVAKALGISGFKSSIEHETKKSQTSDDKTSDNKNKRFWAPPELVRSGVPADIFETPTPWSWSF